MQWMTRVSIRVYLPWSRRKKKRKVREDRCVQKRIVRTLSASICGMLIIVVGVVIALQLNNTDIDLDTSSISTMKPSSKSSEIHPASPSEQPSVFQSILLPSLRPTYGPTVMIRTPGPSVDVSKSNYSLGFRNSPYFLCDRRCPLRWRGSTSTTKTDSKWNRRLWILSASWRYHAWRLIMQCRKLW